MCIICASIPAAAAVGARLSAGQVNKPQEQRQPIMKITGVVIGLLVTASLIYHALRWQ